MFESFEKVVFEWVVNLQVDVSYNVCFIVFEFILLCLMIGQLDFVYLVIDYVSGDWLVEFKFLKLFLGFFCNYGVFYEDCIISIVCRLSDFFVLCWLWIGGYWYLCGGILIDVFWQIGVIFEGVWIFDQGVLFYCGCGQVVLVSMVVVSLRLWVKFVVLVLVVV